MAFLDEDKLAKLLKEEISNNIWLLFGDDAFLKDFYCNKLISLTVDESLKFFNFHAYDEKSELEEIFATAENLPVMSEKTCILVKNYPLNQLSDKALKTFAENLSDIPESTVMIFFYSSVDVQYSPKKSSKWNSAVEIFSKHGVAAQINHRTPAKTAKLLMSKAKDRGTSIDYDTAMYLIMSVGDDMQTLLNEFNKVCSFSKGNPVTPEMIDKTSVKSVEASVFDISNCIFSGDTDKAFAILNELLRQKTPAASIIGALSGAYVNIYRYKTALNADKSISDFSSLFGYGEKYSYTFNKISAYTRKSKMSSIRKALDILADADIKSKSSAAADVILLTELISKLAELG